MGLASLLQNPTILTFDAQGVKVPDKTSTQINGFSNQSNLLIIQAPVSTSVQMQVAYYLPTGKIIGYRPLTLYGSENDLTQFITAIPQSALSEASVSNAKQLKVSIREVLLNNFLGTFVDETHLPTGDVVVGSQAYVNSTGSLWKFEVDEWVDTVSLNYDYKQKKTYELINLSVGSQFLATEEEIQDEPITDIILQSLASLNALYQSITNGATSVQLKDYLLKDFFDQYAQFETIAKDDDSVNFVFQFGDNNYRINKSDLEKTLYVLADKVVDGSGVTLTDESRVLITKLIRDHLTNHKVDYINQEQYYIGNKYQSYVKVGAQRKTGNLPDDERLVVLLQPNGEIGAFGKSGTFKVKDGQMNFVTTDGRDIQFNSDGEINMYTGWGDGKAFNMHANGNGGMGIYVNNGLFDIWTAQGMYVSSNEKHTFDKQIRYEEGVSANEEQDLVTLGYVDRLKTDVEEFLEDLYQTLKWGDL